MRNIIVLLSAGILMLFAACSDETVRQNKDDLQEKTAYIPLQVGNEWIYKRVFGYDSSIVYSMITDSVSINNVNYYVIKYSKPELFDAGLYTETDSTALIRTPDGITYYQYRDGADQIYRIFKDTTIAETEFTEQMVMTSSTELRTHPFLGNDLQYIHASIGKYSEPFSYNYAKGFGLVRFVWFKGYCELIYAKVNGKIYQ